MLQADGAHRALRLTTQQQLTHIALYSLGYGLLQTPLIPAKKWLCPLWSVRVGCGGVCEVRPLPSFEAVLPVWSAVGVITVGGGRRGWGVLLEDNGLAGC